MCKKTKKAQQLVEFAIVLPVIVMFLMILMELSLAFYSRMVFTDAVKISVMKLNQTYSWGGDDTIKKDSIAANIKRKIYEYLESQNIHYSGSIDVNIDNIVAGTSTVNMVTATFNYSPFFNFFSIPDNANILSNTMTFTSSQLINDTLLRKNEYTTFTTTSNLAGFNTFKPVTSALISTSVNYAAVPATSINIESLMGFLIGTDPANDQYARLHNWLGVDLLPSNLQINLDSGYLSVKSPYVGAAWVDTTVPYTHLLASFGITQAIYVKNSSLLFPAAGVGDISTANYLNNIALGLVDEANNTRGSFDPLNSGAYNKVYNYSVTYNSMGTDIYVLKLALPNSTRPTPLNSNYDSKINGAIGNTEITDAYIDCDGDGIPNAWDLHPDYFDANANGIMDGEENAPIVFVSAPSIIVGGVGAGAVTVNIRSPYSYTTGNNVPVENYTYLPQISNILIKNSGGALYYVKGADLLRSTPYWNPANELLDKAQYTHATKTGNKLELNKSLELDKLLLGPFKSAYKVTASE